MKIAIFKNDLYKCVRKGKSHLLELSCAERGHRVGFYQKDGAGLLKRIYIDRILAGEAMATKKISSLKSLSSLHCKKCKELLGIPVLFGEERRYAYRLFTGAITKKIVNAQTTKLM